MAMDRALDRLDAALVERATTGDALAVDEIVTTLSKPFYNLALRSLHNHHDAEDATQEALVRVVTNLSSFRGESRFSTWAWTIATRCVLDYNGGRAKRAAITAEGFAEDLADGMASTSTVDPEINAVLGQVKLGCGRAMLQTLDGDLRVAYALGEILEVPQSQAARALGISDAAFRKRLSRARSQLQTVLNDNCGIVNPSNACRCEKRRDRAISLGRLEPADAVDAAELNVAALTETVRSLDELGQAAAYFGADPMVNASERLLPRVREVLKVT
jgi:RNA polymerase sigma factor (sigma-70 family)